ncbi:hypothetical protein [Bacillus toyonensis]|uniref:hypothetical protein n=1 Tax=Bacillus toyonensis TaxID=155322 RepID=UPI0021760EDD|nr:hypothetical protein [Bacillus toyonensis]
MKFFIVEWHEVAYKNRNVALVIFSCIMIMSGCSNKMVEDGNRKHVFIETSKVLVEVVYKKYKR